MTCIYKHTFSCIDFTSKHECTDGHFYIGSGTSLYLNQLKDTYPPKVYAIISLVYLISKKCPCDLVFHKYTNNRMTYNSNSVKNEIFTYVSDNESI